jgi:hypothetical protein
MCLAYMYIRNHQFLDKNKYDLFWVALSFLEPISKLIFWTTRYHNELLWSVYWASNDYIYVTYYAALEEVLCSKFFKNGKNRRRP